MVPSLAGSDTGRVLFFALGAVQNILISPGNPLFFLGVPLLGERVES